jgi:hypothetical protein
LAVRSPGGEISWLCCDSGDVVIMVIL